MRFLPIAVLLASLGCTESGEFAVDEVLFLQMCPTDSRCERFADGASLVTVEACVPDDVSVLADPLDVTITLSAGRWIHAASDSEATPFTASLARHRCVRPVFVTPTRADPVHVAAEFVGIRTSIEVSLVAARLADVVVVPTPATLSATATSTIQMKATVLATGDGAPTIGTVVSYSVSSVEPATAQAAVYPAQVLVDDDGAASAVLVADKTATSATVRVQATPPVTDDDPMPTAVARDVTLRQLP